MKKVLKKSLLIAGLALMAVKAFAWEPTLASFISPNSAVFLTNNSTVLYGATNVQFIGGDQILRFSQATNVIIPVFVGGTVVNGVNYGGTAYYTNSTTGTAGSQTNGNAWADMNLWPNNNVDSNQTPLTLFVKATLDGGAASTNLLTFTFWRMYGTNVDSGASGFPNANTFVAAFALPGGSTNIISSTNLTSVFQFGATGLRLQKVVVANSSTNAFVKLLDVGISGYKP